MVRTVTVNSTVAAATGQVSCDLAGEAVILHLKGGAYYGLDPVGARIWNLIQEPRTVSDVRDAILQEYEVDSDRCERDVLALLQELAAKDLIEIKDESPA